MSILPYARPDVRAEDIAAVVEVLESQFLTTGPKVPELEAQFAQTVGAKEAVACSNGTTALHLACLALGLKPGDRVIVPATTFLATANAVRMCGADVVFCDVDPENGLMRVEDLEAVDQTNVVAVFPVHMGGYCVDMAALSTYARAKEWKIVEDACHALGGVNQGHLVGACGYSDLATFSLHATKSFTAGEGGMVCTNNQDMAARMRKLRNHGMERNPQAGPWAYEMQELGFNYRLTDLQAALVMSQLSRLDEVKAKRSALMHLYRDALEGVSPHLTFTKDPQTGEPCYHLCQLLIDFEALGTDRARFCTRLIENGVGTQVHYIPVADQPYYTSLYGQAEISGARSFYQQVVALPLYSSLILEEAEKVVSEIKKTVV